MTSTTITLTNSCRRVAEIDVLVDRLAVAFDATEDAKFRAETTERMEFLVRRRAALAAGAEFELALLAAKEKK